MQAFKAHWTFSLVLGFALVAYGCTTSSNLVSPDKNSLRAEAVPEGIMLILETIPEEVTRLFISFQDIDPNTEYQINPDLVFSYSVIDGSALEYVKKTGRVIIPFVNAGQNYFISVDYQENDDHFLSEWTHLTLLECVPYSGMNSHYKDIRLRLNGTRTGIALSSEPVFPEEVQYAFPKFEYVVTVFSAEKSANISSSFGRQVNTLTWNFEPAMTEELKKENYLINGTYSAFIRAFCNIVYDNVTWNVEIAKTQVFIYSL